MDQSGFSGRKTIHLLGLVDHDPAGQLIAHTFRDQLATFGLQPLRLHVVLRPEHFSAAQRLSSRLPLRDDAHAQRWLARGGGVDGGPWTLSVDSLPVEALEARTRTLIREVARRPVARDRMRVPMDDPRWQQALAGPGGAAKVVVLRPDELGEEAMVMVDEGYRLVVVDSGQIIGVLGRNDGGSP